jgi:PAS domain S-box-containing protein
MPARERRYWKTSMNSSAGKPATNSSVGKPAMNSSAGKPEPQKGDRAGTRAAGKVLILAPIGRDAHNVRELLAGHGVHGEICDHLPALAARIDDAAHAVLITEEALLRADIAPLVAALEAQPDWSDLPFVFLFSRRQSPGPHGREAGARLPPRVTNVMLLERPLGRESLLSAIDWALSLRHRQFLTRDQMEALSRQAVLLKCREQELEESRGYLRDLLDSAQEGFYAVDREGRATVCNAAFRRMLGFDSEDEIVGRSMHDIIRHSRLDGSPYPHEECPIFRTARDGTSCHVTDEMFYRQDGVGFPVEYRAQPVYRGGKLVGAVCTFSDLTESLRAARALRAANERLGLVLNSGAIVGSWVWEVQLDRFTGDERFAQTFSLDAQALATSVPISDVLRSIHPDDRPLVERLVDQALGRGGPYRAEYRVRQADGSWRWIEANGQVALDGVGRALRFPGVLIDISERKRVEEALRASDLELRTIADSLPFLIAFVDRDQVYRFANQAYEDWFGLHPKDVVGRHLCEVVDEAGYAVRKPFIERALAGESITLELSWPHRDGRRREAEVRYMPRLGQDGSVLGFHVFVLDATERAEAAEALKEAAEALERRVSQRTAALVAEVAERRKAEEALRQSQKMEAVGQLTGGIAHDFNNMLTGIIGSIDLMKRRIESGRFTGLERFMEAANASAHRAASLTHRLLAFSRRQSLDARPIDVNALVASLEDLLVRTIGEQVTLRVRLAPGLELAHADANQLENALLNLAINARDAMPEGGQLLIETSSLEHGSEAHGREAGAYAAMQATAADAADHAAPADAADYSDQADATLADVEMDPDAGGRAVEDAADALPVGRYVVLSVADTGVGMTADVLARAFEPFYTTKPLGQGTGLGLSMIYGFARQSGGSVRIRSSPGNGTVVWLCLPVAEAVSAPAADDPALDPASVGTALPDGTPAPRRAGGTVLVVEDDPTVRLLVLEVLAELGYAALEAADAQAAIVLLESAQRIDLLVSDVGLPGMNGRQLAEIARQTRPRLRVLFMTGYAENAIIRAGFLAEGMQMVTKPFALGTMALRIREMIEG